MNVLTLPKQLAALAMTAGLIALWPPVLGPYFAFMYLIGAWEVRSLGKGYLLFIRFIWTPWLLAANLLLRARIGRAWRFHGDWDRALAAIHECDLDFRLRDELFCTDALCCFLEHRDWEALRLKPTATDRLLIRAQRTRTGWKPYGTVGRACLDLEIHARVETIGDSEFLFWKLRCSDYENRPAVAREYPGPDLCKLEFYAGEPDSALWFMALTPERTPPAALGFSVGGLALGRSNYYLFPVPKPGARAGDIS